MFGRNPYSSTPFGSAGGVAVLGDVAGGRFADRVKETSTTTGTGNFTLLGAVSGFQTFVAAFFSPVGTPIAYAIVGRGSTEWEVGEGYLLNPTTLVRSAVQQSSNTDAFVNFAAGTKDVFCTISSHYVNRAPTIGQQLAASCGSNMP